MGGARPARRDRGASLRTSGSHPPRRHDLGLLAEKGLDKLICSLTQPVLGICLGMQLTCVGFARNVLNMEGANSAELNPDTEFPIIDIMRDQIDVEDMGGTLRLGLYPCKLKTGSRAAAAYNNQEVVQRRHRHRYEFNTKFRKDFENAGFVFSGVSPDNRLMEIVELSDKKFFVAAQYHPEYQSRPNKAEELYTAFITAAVENSL